MKRNSVKAKHSIIYETDSTVVFSKMLLCATFSHFPTTPTVVQSAALSCAALLDRRNEVQTLEVQTVRHFLGAQVPACPHCTPFCFQRAVFQSQF